jgi:glycosyltransferase involved in cell wall biosynthesis
MRVDLGVFAHNEAQGIADMLGGLLAQNTGGLDLRILVLCNGCTDGTVAAAGVPGVEVVDLPQGGKSRTWNRFVHDLSRPGADVLVFCDADIRLPERDVLRRLVSGMGSHWVMNSRPVKDIGFDVAPRGMMDRVIAAAGGGLDDWKTAICGQFYAMPAVRARKFQMPVGLPVEDGFLRAMVLTDGLTEAEDFSRIGGADVFHVYASERSIPALIKHQTRIVIGSAINAAVFAHLRAVPLPAHHAELARAAGDPDWLSRVIRAQLPRWFGWVPPHFLTKRLARAWRSPRRWPVAILGFGFDVIVYVNAQVRMAFGTGAGHW